MELTGAWGTFLIKPSTVGLTGPSTDILLTDSIEHVIRLSQMYKSWCYMY